MKVTRQARDAHGSALLDAAARLFRGRGLDAVRVADVSAAAGLTHGAFYGHFASKTALAEAACAQSMRRGAERWRARAVTARAEGRDPLDAIIDTYLTEQHRDAAERGCWLGAVGAEAARADAGLRTALAEGTALLVDVLTEEIAARHADWPAAQIRSAAAAVLSVLVGGLVVARACATDPEASRAALASAAALARRAGDLTWPAN
jgi:TetR/AcrR family transcriptional regulator, transcriptional repressor for nem operon